MKLVNYYNYMYIVSGQPNLKIVHKYTTVYYGILWIYYGYTMDILWYTIVYILSGQP